MADTLIIYSNRDFEEHYRRTYGPTGKSFGDVRPAYRYGYMMALNDPKFCNLDWERAEIPLRQAWKDTYPALDWDEFRDAVLQGWRRVRG